MSEYAAPESLAALEALAREAERRAVIRDDLLPICLRCSLCLHLWIDTNNEQHYPTCPFSDLPPGEEPPPCPSE